MKTFVLISAVIIQCSWSLVSPNPDGVDVFAYEDSAGRRYECVFKPKNNQRGETPTSSDIKRFNEINPVEQYWPFRRFLPPLPPLPPLQPLSLSEPWRPLRPLPPLKPLSPLRQSPPLSPFHPLPPLPPLRSFFLNRQVRDIYANIENQQRAAYEAAQNSFGAFNAFPYFSNFDFRYPPYDHFKYSGFGNQAPFDMSGLNSAYAAAAIGPGFRHQVAAISPPNPNSPNIDKTSQYQDNRNGANNGFYSVSSSSFASSVNEDGKLQNQRAAETVVNDNGKITKYSVRN